MSRLSRDFFSAVVLVRSDRTDGRSELVVERVAKEDSGSYACVAENSVGTIKSLGFVSVLGEESQLFDGSWTTRSLERSCLSAEPPTLDGDLRSNWVRPLGGTAILNCGVRGDPTPTVRWNRNGIRIDAGDRVRQLSNGSLAIYGTVVRGEGGVRTGGGGRGAGK